MRRTSLLAAAIAVAAIAVGYGVTRPAAGQAAGLKEIFRVPHCPSHAPKFPSASGTSRNFVRPGAGFLRLCRYYKVNWADSQGLWRQRLIGDERVTKLTRSFNKLQEPPRGIFCVKDNGGEMALFFAYGDGTHERVVVKLSGCRFASNGRTVRSTTPGLHARLLYLSRPR